VSAITNLAQTTAQLALQLLVIKAQRGMTASDGSNFSIAAMATIEEVHSDEMEITEHPVEQGSVIADHAFARPSEVILTLGWSNSPNETGLSNQILGAAANSNPAIQAVVAAAKAYQGYVNFSNGDSTIDDAYTQLLYAYQNRILFDVQTGRRLYLNMLIKSIGLTTNQQTENSMLVRVTCRQILMAKTQTVTVPDSSLMANPESNGATVNRGTVNAKTASNINTNALP
jgi:hypothetical protein